MANPNMQIASHPKFSAYFRHASFLARQYMMNAERLAQHQSHNSSNFLMNLFQLICSTHLALIRLIQRPFHSSFQLCHDSHQPSRPFQRDFPIYTPLPLPLSLTETRTTVLHAARSL
jgi:hypothetical protein